MHAVSLTLSSLRDSVGGLLMVAPGGAIVSVGSALQIGSTGSVTVKSFSAGSLIAPLDVNNQALSNVNIKSGSADLTTVSTQELTVGSLKASSDKIGGSRLVFVDPQGKLQSHGDHDTVISIPNLSIKTLRFEEAEIDFRGVKAKNLNFDTGSFSLGPQQTVHTDDLVVASLSAAKNGTAALDIHIT